MGIRDWEKLQLELESAAESGMFVTYMRHMARLIRTAFRLVSTEWMMGRNR